MTDYSELKMLAEKATPGPWWIDSHGMTMMSMSTLEVVFNHPAQSIAVRNEETGNLSHWRNDWDASFIAAANPAIILALIVESEALRRALTECVTSLEGEVLQKFHGQSPEDMHPVTLREYDRDMAEIDGYKVLSNGVKP